MRQITEIDEMPAYTSSKKMPLFKSLSMTAKAKRRKPLHEFLEALILKHKHANS